MLPIETAILGVYLIFGHTHLASFGNDSCTFGSFTGDNGSACLYHSTSTSRRRLGERQTKSRTQMVPTGQLDGDFVL
jgi:hypothetical protein